MKKHIYIVFILSSILAKAQQEPHYTQYMYNMSMVNPAYMINQPGIIEVGGLYRSQWVGIEGAPKTVNLFANIPLNDRIELSTNYLNDNIGGNINLSENLFNIDAAYKINIKNTLNLSFGIKLGFDHLNFSAIGSNVAGDPLFGNTNKTVLNIGAGIFLFDKKYYTGISSPNLIPASLGLNNEVVYNNKTHVFLIGGYIFNINHVFKLKPSTVLKYTGGAPLSFDLSVNTLYLEKFEFGVSYRYQDAFSVLVGVNVTQNLKLGYAYDFNTSKLKTFNNGSHEFLLIYRFDTLGLSKNYLSPRFY